MCEWMYECAVLLTVFGTIDSIPEHFHCVAIDDGHVALAPEVLQLEIMGVLCALQNSTI